MKINTIPEFEEFFNKAIKEGAAVEVHTKSDVFDHEIDLIPYDEVENKFKWYMGVVYAGEGFLQFAQPSTVRSFKDLLELKINYGYSKVKVADAISKKRPEPESRNEEIQEDVQVQIKKINPNKNVICDKCGKSMFVDRNRMMMSLPPQYAAKCDCGNVKYIVTETLDDKVEWVSLSEFTKMISSKI